MAQRLHVELQLEGRTFPFTVRRRVGVKLGPTVVDQYWMKATPLYSQRKGGYTERTQNHQELLKLFWHAAQLRGDVGNRITQEKLLHALLVPYARPQGSRRVFADAFFQAEDKDSRWKRNRRLQDALVASRGQEATLEAFQRNSLKLLGVPDAPAEVVSHRDRFAAELFDDACGLLDKGDVKAAGLLVLEKWFIFEQTILRRSQRKDEKLALDMLAYEARAAIHDMHVHAWRILLQTFHQQQFISDHSLQFMEFWLANSIALQDGSRLFHGHIFGLHPAFGPFLMCREGQALMGRWLIASTPNNEAESEKCLHLLLHGLQMAIDEYTVESSDRPDKMTKNFDPEDAESRKHRDGRRGGPKHDD